MCGEFFHSRKLLREHVDRHHRITNSKMAVSGSRRLKLATKKNSIISTIKNDNLSCFSVLDFKISVANLTTILCSLMDCHD